MGNERVDKFVEIGAKIRHEVMVDQIPTNWAQRERERINYIGEIVNDSD